MAKERAHQGRPVCHPMDAADTRNPVMCKEGKGVRNFGCPHYDACLDKAAKGMWSGFTCRECELYRQEPEEGAS